jgi:hypothetical protein
VNVVSGGGWKVVVDDRVDTNKVHTTADEVSGNKNPSPATPVCVCACV